ncbi:MAG: adenylate/guanylate cyclase domain-containing protein [Desulfobacterales bacterium]
MTEAELIDVRESAERLGKERRRQILRVLLPIAVVAVMGVAIVVIARMSYLNNRRDAVTLANSLVRLLEQRISAEVSDHLLPAGEMVRLASGIYLTVTARGMDNDVLDTLGIQILKVFPQAVSFYAADPRGNFLMSQKSLEGAIHTKVIDRDQDPPKVTWTRRDTADRVVRVEEEAFDGFDPRTRPWYIGATRTRAVYWTDVYVFFTSGKPGVTASISVVDPDDRLIGVLSIDILLEDLSRFLSNLRIGQSGQALLIDGQGNLVAFPDLGRMLKEGDGTIEPVRVDGLGDPVLTRAFDRFRIEGHGIRNITVDGKRYSSMASSLRSVVGRSWSILITVPEDDFVGFVERNIRRSLISGLIVIAIALVMAGLLGWRSLRTERSARVLLERRRRMAIQNQAFSELTDLVIQFDMDHEKAFEQFSEIVSAAVDVRRVSLWRLEPEMDQLVCVECFDKESRGHSRGATLNRQEYPELFQAATAGETIQLTETGRDPRTKELTRTYLAPLGCVALMAVPVKVRSEMSGAGMIWFEHDDTTRGWSREDLQFARSIAGVLALRTLIERSGSKSLASPVNQEMEGGALQDPDTAAACPAGGITGVTPSELSRRKTALQPDRLTLLENRLKGRGINQESSETALIDGITVMAIVFTDPLFLADPLPERSNRPVLDLLVCEIDRLTEANGVEYVKLMGDMIVCATGFAGGENRHAQRMGAVAIGIQNRLMSVFAGAEAALGFRIGLDTGAIIGSPIGCGLDAYNIWGDAVQAAVQMAASGIPGGIQVTETTYHCIRNDFVFKNRGAFYLDQVGEIRTFLMTGQQ